MVDEDFEHEERHILIRLLLPLLKEEEEDVYILSSPL